MLHALALLTLGWVSPELPLTPNSTEPTDDVSARPAIASSASVTLVAWEEDGVPPGVFLTLVGANGPAPLRGEFLGLDTSDPAVAFDGTSFLLSYWRVVNAGNSAELVGVRFDAAGARLDATPFVIGTSSSTGRLGVVADGTQFVVVWNDTVGLRAKRVSTAGVVLDATPIALTGSSTGFVVAGGNGSTLVASHGTYVGGSGYPVRAQRLGANGMLVDAAPLSLGVSSSSSSGSIAVGSNGTSFLVAVRRDFSSVSATPVPATGAPGAEVSLGTTWYAGDQFAVGTVGNDWLVAGGGYPSTLSMKRLTTAGVVLDAMAREVPLTWASVKDVLLVPRALGFSALVRTTGLHLYDVDLQFSVTRALVVANGSPNQDGVVVASDGQGGALAVWRQGSLDPTHRRVLASRLAPNGATLDSPPIELPARGVYAFFPSVAFDGVNYAVVWPEQVADGGAYDVMLARVSRDGGLLDANPINVGPGPESAAADPTVSAMPGAILSCWSSSGTYEWKCSLFRETANPALSIVFDGGPAIDHVAITNDGRKFVLVATGSTGGLNSSFVNAYQFSATGQREGPALRLGQPVGWARAFAGSGGDGLLLGYSDYYRASVSAFRAVAGANGLDGGAFAGGTNAGMDFFLEPRVAWRPGEWAITFSMSRVGSGRDVLGWRLDGPTGAPVTATAEVIASDPTDENASAIARLGQGFVVTYSRDDDAPDVRAERARYRLWSGGSAPGASCSMDSQCASSTCSMGACCPLGCQFGCAAGACLSGPGVDAGAPDAGVVDAGLADAGMVDAGAFDAGSPVDAGEPDAGLPVDAGTVADAGSGAGGGGGGSGAPVGGGGGGGDAAPSGCGCTSFEGGALWLFGLLLLRRRRA